MAAKTMEKTVSHKNKITERRLSKTMENLNTELASSLSTIVRQVRGIQTEHEKKVPESQSSYMRRRQSVDITNAFDNFHLHPDQTRFRSKSFGHSEAARPKTAGKLKHTSKEHISLVSAGKTIPKPRKSGDKTPVQSSPNEYEIHEHSDTRKSAHRNNRKSIDYHSSSPMNPNPVVARNRRMSLPAIMLSTNDLITESNTRQNSRVGQNGKNGANTSRETSPEGTTLQLKRLQRELNQRKPKSSRELKNYNLTTAEEKQELSKLQRELSHEVYFSESDVDYRDKLYRELQNCSYLRRPSNEENELAIDDVFK